ncbi:hypothetical protein [Paracidovorax oryzae]|uniref:hypothetical protein n=1 Tax=Paracidovorax oryzae TaxID=862720 RepID=UPI000479ACE7|nr:hypothetical protein [Paracidovorax oryzae]
MDHFDAHAPNAAARNEQDRRSPIHPGLLAAGATVIVLQIAAMAWVLEDHVRHAEQQQHAWVARGLQAPAARSTQVPGQQALQAEAGWTAGTSFAAR